MPQTSASLTSTLPPPLRSEISALISYDGYNPFDSAQRPPQLASSVMQALAAEIRVALLLRNRTAEVEKTSAGQASGNSGVPTSRAGALAPHVLEQLASVKAGERPTIRQLAAPAAPAGFLAAAAARSRGREIDRKRAMIASSARTEGGAGAVAPRVEYEPAAVSYRYQEGFTNAVRRPVRLRDFGVEI